MVAIHAWKFTPRAALASIPTNDRNDVSLDDEPRDDSAETGGDDLEELGEEDFDYEREYLAAREVGNYPCAATPKIGSSKDFPRMSCVPAVDEPREKATNISRLLKAMVSIGLLEGPRC